MKRELQLCCILTHLITGFATVTPLDASECPRNLSSRRDATENSTDHLSYRLPKHVVPTKYSVHLEKNERDFTYLGSVSILLKVLEPTSTVVVHSDGLRIVEEQVNLRRSKFPSIPENILCQFHDRERQFYVVRTERVLEPSEYTLTIKFEGEIRDDVFGFYRSFYKENGGTKWMAVTQFSPTYARRAFPCMDEPHLKAVFQLRFRIRNETVTSNTRIIYKTSRNEYIFEETPRMSTYLLGWAMHDFVSESSTNRLRFSQNFRMWTRRSMNHRGSIALRQGQSIYSFLNDWLLVDNPIPKMDQIAVPDFNFHAMENWGMITYRESVVLYDDELTPTRNMLDGFTTMAHEYAHTWFGNLVTPTFWDVAWLKEGFASYFQYFAVSVVQPTWRMMDKFVVDTLQPAMLLDSADHDRVMNGKNVGSPSSIMAVLDFVSYKKGASVIRMLSHVIGESAFRDGLRSYVKNMSYDAATPHDLYRHLQSSADNHGQLPRNMSIEGIMESWTNQPGYPLVTVARNYDMGTFTVSQERFRWNKTRDQSQSELRWWIPLTFTTETARNFSAVKPRYWLKRKCENLTAPLNISSSRWIIFNIQQTGYYRVNYDENNWQMIARYLSSRDFLKVHRANRAALIDDAFNLARAGYIDYSIAFNLSKYLVREIDHEPWVAAVNNLKFLNNVLSGTRVQRAFQEYANRLLQPRYKQLNFTDSKDEDITAKLNKELILTTSCLVGNVDCLNMSESLFRNWITKPDETIPRDVKSFVYCEGIRSGGEEDWYLVMDRWLNTDLQTEQDLLLQGLGCTRESGLIKSYLELSVTDEQNVRKQQRMMIVSAILDGNVENVDHVLEFVRSNLQRIIELRGNDFLGKVISGIGQRMRTRKQTEALRAFIQGHSKQLGSTLDTARKALSAALENVKWIKKYLPSIVKYFT